MVFSTYILVQDFHFVTLKSWRIFTHTDLKKNWLGKHTTNCQIDETVYLENSLFMFVSPRLSPGIYPASLKMLFLKYE